MQNKRILRYLQVLGCVVALVGLYFLGMYIQVQDQLDLQTTYIAAHDILPRQQITAQDLVETQVASAYLLDNTIQSPEELIGKYTNIQGMIPSGSAFYKGMVVDEEDLPDQPTTMLLEGQSAYSISTDLASAGGNMIVPGQRVDVYLSIDQRDEKPISDCLLEHARVLAIKDSRGLDVYDENSSGIPYLITLAVSHEDLALLSVAEKVGEIRIFPSSESYNTTLEASLKKDSLVIASLQEQSTPSQEPVLYAQE